MSNSYSNSIITALRQCINKNEFVVCTLAQRVAVKNAVEGKSQRACVRAVVTRDRNSCFSASVWRLPEITRNDEICGHTLS